MKSSTINKKLEEMEQRRDALRAQLDALQAQCATSFDPAIQAQLRNQKAELQGELEDLEAAIAAGRKAYEGALAAEAQKNTEKWQSELHPQAMAEREQALSAVLDKLAELRAAYDQLRATEARWKKVREELGSPLPALRPLAESSLADFLIGPASMPAHVLPLAYQKRIHAIVTA